jgi:hypothetical protein
MARRRFLAASAAGALSAGLVDAAPGADRKAKARHARVPRGERLLRKGGCVLSLDPNVGDFEQADVLIEGAKDNRLERKIGTLTPGKEADIIMLRMHDINVMPVNNAYGAIVLGMDTSHVDTVLIAGRIRKWRGKLVDVDLDRISRLVHQSRDDILSRVGWPRTLLGGYLPGH